MKAFTKAEKHWFIVLIDIIVDIIHTLNRVLNYPRIEYLLIFGDETIVPPIYNGTIPSDDFYTSPGILSANPQLSTGRIPVNNILDAED